MKKANLITKKIREAGMTVKGWARVNGFSPPSVVKAVGGDLLGNGPVGAAIITALKRDGFWAEEKTT